MAIDNRDWYRNLLRKKTGYVERSTFRRPATDDEVIRVLGPSAKPRVVRPSRNSKSSRAWLYFCGFIGVVLLLVAVKLLAKLF